MSIQLAVTSAGILQKRSVKEDVYKGQQICAFQIECQMKGRTGPPERRAGLLPYSCAEVLPANATAFFYGTFGRRPVPLRQ